MHKKSVLKDAWLNEAEESSRMVEDLETIIKNNNLNHQHSFAESKLLDLGMKLDRLESLLHNPPSKPILTGEELEFRWKMLSDLIVRTRYLAFNLYKSPSSNKSEGLAATDTKHYYSNVDSENQVQDQRQASFSNIDPDLLNPLVLDDSMQRQVQMNEQGSSIAMKWLHGAFSTICVIAGAAAFIFLLVVICAII